MGLLDIVKKGLDTVTGRNDDIDIKKGVSEIGGDIASGAKQVVTQPKEALDIAHWVLLGGKRPFGPGDETQTPAERLASQAKAAETPETARYVLNQILGADNEDDKQFLDLLSKRDDLSKILGVQDDGNGLSLEPFSDNMTAMQAVGGVKQMKGIDPYRIGDTLIQAAVGSDEHKQLLYLRETDPLSVMPFIFEQDQNKNPSGGGRWWDNVTDWVARPIVGAKDLGLTLLSAPERVEEAIGYAAYNDVQNPYMRLEMAKRFYDYRLNFWDWHETGERDARNASAYIDAAAGADNEVKIKGFQDFMQNQKLGVSGTFANLLGQAIFDPMWLVPADKIIEGGKFGVKAATGAEDAGKIARLGMLFSPAGRSVAGEHGLGEMLRMGELSYQQKKWTSPAKGAMRILFEQDPGRLADETVRTVGRWTAGSVGREIFTSEARTRELLETIRTGKPTKWIAEKLPGLMDDPTIAALSARVSTLPPKGKSSLAKIFDKGIDSDFFRGAIEAGAGDELETVLRHTLTGTLRNSVLEQQQALFKSTAFGRALSGPYARYVNAMKPWVSLVTISRPAFVTLNLVNNAFTFMWSAARHPFLGPETLARSFWLEGSSVLKSGGRYPEVWEKMLRNPLVDMTPLDVELSAAHNVGIHDILAPRLAKASDIKLEDATAQQLMDDIQRQAAQPVKQIIKGDPHKFLGVNSDKLMWPVYLAGRIDTATRRATFMLSLQEQLALAQSPSWAAKTIVPKIAQTLMDNGVEQDVARHIEGSIIDEFNHAAMGVSTRGATSDEILTGIFDDIISKAGSGHPTAHFSATNAAWDYLTKTRGYDSDAARFAMRDLNPVIERATTILNEDVPKILDGSTKLSTVRRKLKAISDEYFDYHDIARQLHRQPGMMRGSNTYTSALRLTDEGIQKDMVDTSMYLERHLRSLYRGRFKSIARDLNTTLSEATAGQAQKLHEIRQQYRNAAKVGLDSVPSEDLAKLPSALRGAKPRYNFGNVSFNPQFESDIDKALYIVAQKSPSKADEQYMNFLRKVLPNASDEEIRAAGNGVRQNIKNAAAGSGQGGDLAIPDSGLRPGGIADTGRAAQQAAGVGDLGKMWEDYFASRDAAWDKVYQFVREKTGKLSDAHVALVDEWYDDLKKTMAEHSRILGDAAREGTDEAWSGAGRAVKNLYEKNARRRPEIFGFPANDMPAAHDVMDPTGPLAAQVDEYVDSMVADLTKKIPSLMDGSLVLGDDLTSKLEPLRHEMATNWNGARQQVIGQAMAKTDFVMLNYNNQLGMDKMLQGFVPFEFWPTRSAMNWGIRAARNPAAATSLYLAMMAPAEYSKQYGIPDRLKFQIPVPLPFLDEALKSTPVLNKLLGDADFSNVYYVDPIKYMFPYASYRQQFDDQQRKATTFGKVMDWMENYTPLSLNPFAKVLGSETGLIDKDAWGQVTFSGGPFGIPLTQSGKAAARFLYNGDLNAIPPEEQYTFTNKGHFSLPFFGQVLGLEPGKFDDYRAERAAWALAATDKLAPGKPHDEQVRDAFEAVENHKGVAWARAQRAASSESFLKDLSSWAGFSVTGVEKGEAIWMALKPAYNMYAEQGKLNEFFTKYPEFQVRSAVVKGVSDPAEKTKAIDTELYYADLKRIVDDPFEAQVEQIEGKLVEMRNLPQTEAVRDAITQVQDQLDIITKQKQDKRDQLDIAYPDREKELSINRDPRGYALAQVRSQWFDIKREPGETMEAYRSRQETFLSQFAPEGGSTLGEQGWQDVYKDSLLTKLRYNNKLDKAYADEDFAGIAAIKEERDGALTSLHEQAAKGLSRMEVESYLASFNRRKTPEEIKFDKAHDTFDLWMSLVGSGSTFTSKQKGQISAYFKSLPEIQLYFQTSSVDLGNLTPGQQYALMDRRKIWKQYFAIDDPTVQLDWMSQNKARLINDNDILGLPTLNIVDYRRPPAELGIGDPYVARVQSALAVAREKGLAVEDPTLTPEQIKKYSEQLAASVSDDPSPMTADDIQYYSNAFGTAPDETGDEAAGTQAATGY